MRNQYREKVLFILSFERSNLMVSSTEHYLSTCMHGVMNSSIAEYWGAYHLHGKPGNSSWKIKWYVSFHLKYF